MKMENYLAQYQNLKPTRILPYQTHPIIFNILLSLIHNNLHQNSNPKQSSDTKTSFLQPTTNLLSTRFSNHTKILNPTIY